MAKIQDTTFRNTHLQEVDITECDLTNSMFDNCDLSNAIFDNTIIEKQISALHTTTPSTWK